jgi:GNAT superfamily N-acetyltransferase
VRHEDITRSTRARGNVRTLRQQEELPQLRDHLLRLDPQSRHDRFHGFMDDDFIERYAAKCADDGTVIIAYIEDGVVRGAAELHPPDQSTDSQPEIAFSVETCVRRQGVGSILFRKLIAEARSKGYRSLRITTGAQNQAMRALANKFGAHLTFRHGESTGSIDLRQQPQPEPAKLELGRPELGRLELGRLGIAAPAEAARAIVDFNRAYWKLLLRMYGWGRTA